MGVREWVEEKVDRVKTAVKRPIEEYSDRRERESRDSAEREYRDTSQRTYGKVRRGEISQELADRWMSRAEARRKKKAIPIERRVASGSAKALIGAADVAYNPGGRPTQRLWGVAGFSETPRYARKISSGRRESYSILSGSAKSYKQVPKSFKTQRSSGQFGSFLITGSHTKKSTTSGWNILYGSKGSRYNDRGDGYDRPRRRGRRSKRNRDGGGQIGFL